MAFSTTFCDGMSIRRESFAMEPYLHINRRRATSFEHLLVVRLPFLQNGVERSVVLILKEMVVSSRRGSKYGVVRYQTKCKDSKATMPGDDNLWHRGHSNQIGA